MPRLQPRRRPWSPDLTVTRPNRPSLIATQHQSAGRSDGRRHRIGPRRRGRSSTSGRFPLAGSRPQAIARGPAAVTTARRAAQQRPDQQVVALITSSSVAGLVQLQRRAGGLAASQPDRPGIAELTGERVLRPARRRSPARRSAWATLLGTCRCGHTTSLPAGPVPVSSARVRIEGGASCTPVRVRGAWRRIAATHTVCGMATMAAGQRGRRLASRRCGCSRRPPGTRPSWSRASRCTWSRSASCSPPVTLLFLVRRHPQAWLRDRAGVGRARPRCARAADRDSAAPVLVAARCGHPGHRAGPGQTAAAAHGRQPARRVDLAAARVSPACRPAAGGSAAC